MNRIRKPLFAAGVAAIAVSGLGQIAMAEESDTVAEAVVADETSEQAAVSVPGNLYFTDEQGRPRNPSPEELIATSEALQADIARITGKKKHKVEAQTHANGMVSANVAPSKLMFLTAQENEDGELVIRHAELDAEGNLSAQPANTLPEM